MDSCLRFIYCANVKSLAKVTPNGLETNGYRKGTHHEHSPARDFGSPYRRRVADMALQFIVGILSERRAWADSTDCSNPSPDRPAVERISLS